MNTFQVTILDAKYDFPIGVSLEEVMARVKPEGYAKIVAAKVDGILRELTFMPVEDCRVEPVDLRNEDGLRIYIRGLSFIYIMAVRELYEGSRVEIDHSISGGLYCRVHWKRPLTQRDVAQIETRMHEIVAENMPFDRIEYTKEEAVRLFEADGQMDKVRLLKYRPYDHFNVYRCSWMNDYFYGYMVPSTGYLDNFALHYYLPGMVLQHPRRGEPEKKITFFDQRKLADVFWEASRWGEILQCVNTADLNRLVEDGQLRNFIFVNEALHEKKIAEIADQISQRGSSRKLVLIAGPSSSGKTTFAHRLSVQLQVNGMSPVAISLDNYYRNRDELPLGPDGKRNFENIDSIDVELFNEHLSRLLQSEEVELPEYDFTTGRRRDHGRILRLGPDQPVVVEGIHGLNPALTQGIPPEMTFKIYISALTQLNLDDHNRIPTTDTRLVRRLVRDHHFRGFSAEETLDVWTKVRMGEEKNIFPYQEEADAMFNSSLVYEFSVLKPFVMPLLRAVPEEDPNAMEVIRLRKFMNYFLPFTDLEAIPNTSIIREFVGGSCFEE